MADIADYIQALSIGTDASGITGKPADGFVAGGFAAFVQAITGKPPAIQQLPDRKARVVLSQEQVVIMRKWLDSQFWSVMKKSDSSLTLGMGPVIVPWALKYLIPAALLFVVAGWLSHWYLTR